MKSFFSRSVVSALLLTGSFVAGCSATPSDSSDDNIADNSEALVGRICGTRGARACGRNEYCKFPRRADCGRSDSPGRCTLKPRMCNRREDLVCGCDGTTYTNACQAHAAGVSVASDGACEKPCGPDGWRPILLPTLAQVQGVWTRLTVSGLSETSESLRLRSDSTYVLEKTMGPHCEPNSPCPRFATRYEESHGTFSIGNGTGIQLVPSVPAYEDMALSWIFETSCEGFATSRLSSGELGVDVHLKRDGSCLANTDCTTEDGGPGPRCAPNSQPSVICTEQKTCAWTCNAPPSCPAGQKSCMACGAPPPDGICRNFVCVDVNLDCPLFL